jgi:hypothetical protein
MNEPYCSGRIGCAYYDPVKCVLIVLEDTQDTEHFDLANMSEFYTSSQT